MRHWYTKTNPILTFFLFPLSYLFRLIVGIRHYLYQHNILKKYSVPVPVIIVGNITVGGVGKTPFSIHLAKQFINNNINVGVVLRGYKGSNENYTTVVDKNSTSEMVGDEAMLYMKAGIPVVIGRNRYLAAKRLLLEYPNTKFIISDDGLQHYKLKRDYEIIVVDGANTLGNGYMLPMGPCREPQSRLLTADAIILTNIDNNPNEINNFKNKYNIPSQIPILQQKTILKRIYNPISDKVIPIQELQSATTHKIVAMTGIGNPDKFFNFINSLDIKLYKTYQYPDHHYFKPEDIPVDCDIILVTSKDYVKLQQYQNSKILVVDIDIDIQPVS